MPRLYLINVSAAPIIFMFGCVFGCVNPSSDYDDFRGRVAAAYDAGPIDSTTDAPTDASRDGSVFDEAGVAAFSGTYWGACLDASYKGDLSKVTYDVLKVTFTKNGDGSVSISGTRQALRADASNVSQTSGDVTNWPSSPVDVNGSYTVHVATFIEPKDTNGFGLDLTVENGAYAFTAYSPDLTCGKFTGNVTAPIPQAVDETCIALRPNADGSFTRLTSTDQLHCP